jgi:hypothetical protein
VSTSLSAAAPSSTAMQPCMKPLLWASGVAQQSVLDVVSCRPGCRQMYSLEGC